MLYNTNFLKKQKGVKKLTLEKKKKKEWFNNLIDSRNRTNR